ncbi:amino acid adenylation domain-containing protein [Cohnella cellulosilytica]|uniref:Amino acid adenylation domain-containing protein n=1 Tax=Cohnella cellulosilytica TaxID=986710 RepID=A0ABW2FQJ3_9BACL
MTTNYEFHAGEFLARLRGDGATLWEEGGSLRYKAPKGVVTPSDLQTLKENKASVLTWLRSEAQSSAVIPHPLAKYEPFPLTDVQAAYLLGRNEAFEYGGVACHIYLELYYPSLDPARVEAAWNRLVDRHDMLRAVIRRDGSQQVLEKVPRFEVAFADARGWDESRAEAELGNIREEMGRRIYDTERWPLFGVALTAMPDHALLHFSIEFLIADWASIWLLLAEFETLYFRPEQELPPLTLRYRDYMLAERRLRDSAAYAADKEYWLRRLDELPSAPDLPLAPAHSRFGKARFTRRSLQLDASRWSNFKRQAQRRGLTPTAAVMTAYAAVIERWSRSRAFSLNLTVLNRLPLHPEVRAIVGDFTSVSLLAVDWNAALPFGERARAVNGQLFADLDHRLYSGVEVLREMSHRRGREAALMPIVFTSAIGLVEPTEENRLIGREGHQGISQTPQVFVDCQAMDGPFGLQVNWDIRDGVFPSGMMDDMFGAFERLLHSLADSDRAWDQEEAVPLPAWQTQERLRVNATAAPLSDGLLHGGVLKRAAEAPNRTAVIDNEGQVTYEELLLRTSAITGKLKEAGCREGDRVAIVMEKSSCQVAAVLATLFAGAVYVPIDRTQPQARRLTLLEQAKVRYVLTSEGQKGEGWPSSVSVIAADRLQSPAVHALVAEGDPDRPAYIIHTSGSTGLPKGVVMTHRAAVNTIEDINRRFRIGASDAILGLSQLGFDLSVYDIFGTLSAGGTLVLPSADRQTDPSHWAELMNRHGVTVWNSAPALMTMLEAYLNADSACRLPRLRLALLSGDWIPPSLPDRLAIRLPGAQIVSLGGATEAAIWSICHLCNGLPEDWASIPYGLPLANQSFRVLDGAMRDCPVWVTGELYIAGAGLALGYDGNADATARSFVSHPADGQRLYRTGDLGRYRPGGEIEFLGREDHQIKLRGHRIELGEIEATLQRHPAVETAVALIVGEGEARALFAVVEADGKGMREEELAMELTAFLADRLPAYMIPAELRVADSLPLTSNGKVDRKALAGWRRKLSVSSSAASSPSASDPLLAGLLQIWADALGRPTLEASRNIYEVGADSLVMAQAAGKLREWLAAAPYEVDIPFDALLRQMLNYPTVDALATFVRARITEAQTAGDRDAPAPGDRTREDEGSNAVLTFYGGDGEGPLRVVFHAGLGTMNCFHLLLGHLKEQQAGPVVGITIKDTELYCSLEPAETIGQLADDYAKRLAATGHGEMQLIGYCLGGLIAVETARRLLENGVRVTDLVLVDSHPVPYDIADDLVIESLFVPNLNISLEQAGFTGVTPDEFVDGLRHIFEANGRSVPAGSSLDIGGDNALNRVGQLFRRLEGMSRRERFAGYVNAMSVSGGNRMPVEMAEGLFKVYRQSLQSARFTPLPYPGDIRFLLANEPFTLLPGTNEMTLGFWQEVCLGEFTVREIAGNHYTCIEAEPNAGNLAAVIGEALRR